MPDFLEAKNFHLTEPSRGVYVVNYRVGEKLRRMTITQAQLANFLVDGAAIALRSELLDPENGAGGKQPAPPASALPRPRGDADASVFQGWQHP